MSRIVDKYLADTPSADSLERDFLYEMREVVELLACLTDHLCSNPTAAQSAERLRCQVRRQQVHPLMQHHIVHQHYEFEVWEWRPGDPVAT